MNTNVFREPLAPSSGRAQEQERGAMNGRTEPDFEVAYAALQRFAAASGHASPRRSDVVDGVHLCAFVAAQRRSSTMPQSRRQRLEALPGWRWTPVGPAEAWERGYVELVAFVARHGHARPKDGYTSDDDFALGRWVAHQRRRFHDGVLPVERVERLEALSGWLWRCHDEAAGAAEDAASFARGLAALVGFAHEHEHLRVPAHCWRDGVLLPQWTHLRVPAHCWRDGVLLPQWTRAQRAAYRRNQLSRTRIAALEAVPGWTWSNTRTSWDAGFAALSRFAATHGHVQPSPAVVIDGVDLSAFVSHQRRLNKKGRLPRERAELLDTLPGWQWALSRTWDEMYSALVDFANEHGHACPIHVAVNSAGITVGHWVTTQRVRFHRGELDDDQVARLQALPGWQWTVDRWSRTFAELVDFADRHGHTHPGAKVVTDSGVWIGAWVSVQRRAFRSGALSQERAHMLESLPGWMWSPPPTPRSQQSKWDAPYQSLIDFAAAHGHASPSTSVVTSNGLRLGAWVHNQRRNYRQGKLSADRAARLEALPGWQWRPGRPRQYKRRGSAAAVAGAA